MEQQKQSAEEMAAKVEEKQAMQRMNEQLESENAALLAELSLKEKALAGAGLPMNSHGELQHWPHSEGGNAYTRRPGGAGLPMDFCAEGRYSLQGIHGLAQCLEMLQALGPATSLGGPGSRPACEHSLSDTWKSHWNL